jgi:hypothetical protein
MPTPAANVAAATGPASDSDAATAANDAIVSGFDGQEAHVLARRRRSRGGVQGLRAPGGRAPLAPDRDQAVDGDTGQHGGGDQADLALMAREGSPDDAAGGDRDHGKGQVDGRDAHARGHADTRPADHRGLDDQQADGADLYCDGGPGSEAGQ